MSPPVASRSERSNRTPPRTLDAAEAGDSGVCPASSWPIQLHVSGMICITPRAPALDVRLLLKPLSREAIAFASEGETPCSSAIEPTSDAVRVSSVGYGGSLVDASPASWSGSELGVSAACAAELRGCSASLEPPESLSAAPASSSALGSMPLVAASSSVAIPARAAISESVSPGCTT